MSGEQRTALYAAKLDALVARQWGADPTRERRPFGAGAAAAVPGVDDELYEAWVYPVGYGVRSLGVALVWAVHHQVQRLNLLVDDDSAEGDGTPRALARRATYFAEPRITVWAVPATASAEGGSLTEPDPAPLRVPPQPVPAGDLVDLLLDSGAELVVEGGLIRAEVNGLEVARISPGEMPSAEASPGEEAEGPRLEVGVGAADRELTAMVHAGLSPVDKLARVVELVREHRRPGAAPHPLGRLVPERWLRTRVVKEPGLVGLATVRPTESPYPRANLTEPAVAVAQGRTGEGAAVVLAFSVGVDVDLVPAAADARALVDPSAELWLVVPEQDELDTTRALADRLLEPARVVTVGDDWQG